MISISGYQFGQLIHESANSIVYRGQRRADNLPVILKILKQPYPSPEQITAFKNEYDLLHQLDLRGVIKAYALEKNQQRWVMVLEDFGGQSLSQLNLVGQLNLSDFLDLAIKITGIVGQVHQHYIIHKDINPSNILVSGLAISTNNQATNGTARWEVKLTDFGISTKLSRENPTFSNPNVLEGTLAYISPEQTGRMNRPMDYRTDYYSLGATLYELLTGRRPFDIDDPLELVHAHIARPPISPCDIKPDVPKVIANIILKLLAKDAEDRYQSAYGLKADLEACLEQWQERGTIQPFPLGREDISDKLQIPQKLYGRRRELDALIATFERVSQPQPTKYNRQVEVFLVGGDEGSGRSALAQALYTTVTQRHGYFVSSKFDRFNQDAPYTPLIEAFKRLTQQLLMEGAGQIAAWREKLQPALGRNGSIMTSLIPELEEILGSQAPLPDLGAAEAENRFKLVFRKFVHVFASPEHPLVIFLDNLQWADAASLQLLEDLLTAPEQLSLLLIGAYQADELPDDIVLLKTVRAIRQAGVTVTEITLPPLTTPDIAQMLLDAFHCEPEAAASLAEVIQEKTDGNPYFINEFLRSIHAAGLLNFQHRIGRWQWNLEKIRQQAVTDNVIQLMANKLNKLPEETQELVKLATCVGHHFDLETLSVVAKQPAEEVTGALWAAVSEGLILLVSRNYHFDEEGNDRIEAEYEFAHSRVQQAIYSLITPDERETLHWRIGQLMLRHTLPHQQTEKIFDLVNQLNLGRNISVTHSEWDELAELNKIAGQKAKATAAYQTALNYLKIGIGLLNQMQSTLIRGAGRWGGSWQRQYELSLTLHTEAAEVAYLNGAFEQMETFVEAVLTHGKTLLDKERVYEIQMRAYIAQNRFNEVIQTGLPVLKSLGVRFPRVTNEANVKLAIQEIEAALEGQSVEQLVTLPRMTDPYHLASMRILSILSSAAYFANPDLLPFVVIKLVTLSVQHGSAPESTLAYATYGLLLCGSGDDVETGYQFGKLATKLLEELDDKRLRARTLYEVSTYIRHWKEHLNEGLGLLLEAYNSGQETGDLEYASRSAMMYGIHAFLGGNLLPNLERCMATYSDSLEQLKQQRSLQINEVYRQTLLALLTPTEEEADSRALLVATDAAPAASSSAGLDSEFNQTSTNSLLFHHHFTQLILRCLFNDPDTAVEQADLAERYLDSVNAMAVVPTFYFYDSLARLKQLANNVSGHNVDKGLPQLTTSEREASLQRVTSNQNRLRRWMQQAPMNYLHKYYLVEAEYARVLGRDGAAREFYDKAIMLTQEHQYVNDEAIANELASQFYLDKGQSEFAQIYLQKAHQAYSYWGAKIKAQELEAKHPEMLTRMQSSALSDNPITTSVSRTQGIMGALDLTSVLKASQAISGEIMLDKLLSKMMKIIIENAGAERGFLIFSYQGTWVIEAEGSIGESDVKVLTMTPVTTLVENQITILPTSIINYVEHTRDTVVLKDATKDNQFQQDSYIKARRPVSVLCTPLIHQAKLLGMVYLENNLSSDVFTPARLEILNLLSSQAAISIENAHSYARQLELTKAYSRFVPRQILNFLNKESIVEVELGDQIQQEMTVLFSDIRSFTTLLEQMTPEESFRFINAYLGRVSPIIREHNGFIDKYIGDAIMALFPDEPEDAIRGAIGMQQAVMAYNAHRATDGQSVPIQIGAGLHTGNVMLGTIGEVERMEGTVISDTVNLASRLEGLTKIYGASIIVSEQTLFGLENPDKYRYRFLDKVKVKGKTEPVSIFEILEGGDEADIELKLSNQSRFESGIAHYNSRDFTQAEQCFKEVLRRHSDDMAAALYLRRVEHFIKFGVPVDWEGVEALQQK